MHGAFNTGRPKLGKSNYSASDVDILPFPMPKKVDRIAYFFTYLRFIPLIGKILHRWRIAEPRSLSLQKISRCKEIPLFLI
jgi:hypothetical protein